MPEPKNTNKTMATKPSHRLLCGQLGPALSHGRWICEHCKIEVQAEVLSKKFKAANRRRPSDAATPRDTVRN